MEFFIFIFFYFKEYAICVLDSSNILMYTAMLMAQFPPPLVSMNDSLSYKVL